MVEVPQLPPKIENYLCCTIRNLNQFKTCLESVKFATKTAAKFNDVILQAHMTGITLKSAAQSGNIMTRCMIRKDFFDDKSYTIELKNEEDKERVARREEGHETRTLIEFCLPFGELMHMVNSMVDDDSGLMIEYPYQDNMLKVDIPEESKSSSDRLAMMTTLQLETYEATHTLDADYSFKNRGVAA